MSDDRMTREVHAAGDNSVRQLWNNRVDVSPKFMRCDDFPCPAARIRQISIWDQTLAILETDAHVLFKDPDNDVVRFKAEQVLSIASNRDAVFGLIEDGRILDITKEIYLRGSGYRQICASGTWVCAIDLDRRAVAWSLPNLSQHKVLGEGVNALGCTDSSIFFSDANGLWKWSSDGSRIAVACRRNITSIHCSDCEVVFADDTGSIYRLEFGATSRIFGLPPVTTIAVGPQHFAALSEYGELFLWGFNPSGQLAIGNDRSTFDPVHVLSGVIFVACGAQHTLIVRDIGDRTPIKPRVTRAEYIM